MAGHSCTCGGGPGATCDAARVFRAGTCAMLRALVASQPNSNVNAEDVSRFLINVITSDADVHLPCLRLLLGIRGVDPNRAVILGFSPLSIACQEGRSSRVQALLEVRSIDVNHATDQGMTALMIACWRGHVACVAALLSADGVDVAATDSRGRTALEWSATRATSDNVRCLQALLAAPRAAINRRNAQDNNATVLHTASALGKAEHVAVLLAAGACRFQRDDLGRLPAERGRHTAKVVEAFASGVDYWRRRRHRGQAPAMGEVVRTLLLTRQRLGARRAPGRTAPRTRRRAAAPPLPHLPEEIWLRLCGFLRSADFVHAA